MANLDTTYLGLKLDNPLIVSSSSLTANIEGVKKAAEAGAGAVILKSLFEEQIEAETGEYAGDSPEHAEAYDYINQTGMTLGPASYLDLIRQAKAAVKIPVIASVNCVSAKWWKEYARQLETAGADALEVNLSLMPRRFDQDSNSLEKEMISTVETIRESTSLRFAVKIGPYVTGLPGFATEMRKAGADALVLFNRFYQFDFDLDGGAPRSRVSLTNDRDYHMALRWTSILFDRSGIELSASTGIHNGETALKMIAAGASTAQVCSVLYRKNMDEIGRILSEMNTRLDELGIGSIDELRGRYSQKSSENPEAFERLQYIKALTGVS
jgi:dihydroorotate dehydrogenase (fumarate)